MNARIRVVVRAVAVLAMAAISLSSFGATVTWDAGGGNGNWSDPLNWSTNALPTSSDDVVLTNATSFDTVLLDQNAAVQSINVGNGVNFHVQAGWTLTVNGPTVSTVDAGGDLRLDGAIPTGGSLAGNGAFAVDGVFGVHGNCTLGGTGAVTINSGGGLEVGSGNSSAVISISRNITNNAGGTITFLNTGVANTTFNGITIANAGTIDVQNGKKLIVGTGSPVLDNNSGGVLRKSVGTGSAEIDVTVNNAAGATIDVQTGELVLKGGGTVSGAHSMSSSRFLHLSAGTFTMSGNPTFSGSGVLSVDGGTLDAGTGVDVTFPNLDLKSGTITGAGAVRVSGNFNWAGGTIAGSGSRTLNSTSTPIISCSDASCLLDGATLQLQASTTYSASSPTLLFCNGASLVLDAGKTFSITNDGDIHSGCGAGNSIINGTIWKKTTSGASALGVPLTLSGTSTVDIDAGTLQFGGGANVASGATIDVAAGQALEVIGGVFEFDSGAVTMAGSGAFKVSAGTLRVPTGVTLNLPNVTLQASMFGSGVIDGAGTLNLSSAFTWSGGTITGSGPRVVQSASTPTISCSSANCVLDGATLRFQEHGTYSASSNALVLSNGASLILDPGKILFVTNDGDFVDGGGAASSIVVGGFGSPGLNGCIEKNTTAGTSIIGVPVALSGSFKVDAGTLQIGADVTAVAGAIVHYSVGTTIEVTGGVFLFSSSSISVTQPGDFVVSAGTLRVPTGIAITMPNVTLQGSGVIDGGGTLSLTGGSTWLSGTMGSATAPGGITQINSGQGLNITPTSPVSLVQTRQLINNGTAAYGSLGSDILTMSGNSKITNNGAMNLNDGTIGLSGSAVIENYGTMTKVAGTGTTTFFPPVENKSAATISATTGTIALAGGGVAAGAYSISSGADITLDGGTFTVASTATVTGAGTFSIGAATLDAGVGVDLTIPNLALAGGTITGAGAVRVSGNFTWSAGTIAGSGPRVLNSTSLPVISCSIDDCLLDGATLQLQASTTTFSASSNVLVLSNGAGLTIDAGKTLSITNDGNFSSGVGGGGSISNDGTLRKTGMNVIGLIGVPVTSSGTSSVTIDSGTLQFSGGATVASGATIDIAASKTLEVVGGVFLFNSGPVSMPGSGDFKVTAGTLRVPTAVTITMPKVTLQGSGVIDGGGTLILSGTSTWTGGTMGSATAPGGITQIDSGNTLNILGSSSPQLLTQNRQLLNNGTLSYAGIGANTLTMSAGSKITNNGTFNLTNNSVIDNSPAGSALIENNGTFARSSGSGGSTIFPRVENSSSGTLSVITGAGIQLWGGGVNAGVYAISSGADITLAPGNFTFTSTSAVAGGGVLVISDAIVDISTGANLVLQDVSFTGGRIEGVGALHVSGDFTWSGGTIAGAGPRVLDSSSTPVIDGGFGTCTLDGAALQLQASATFSASNAITFSNGASLTIDPGKTLSITNNGDFSAGVGGGSIVNNGTIAKNTAAGTTLVGVPLTMSGTSTVDLDAGTLQFGGGATVASGATIDGAGGTTLEVTGGVFLVSSGPVSMPGSGVFKVSGGTLRVPTGTVAMPNVTLQGPGVIDGAGTLVLSGTSTWASGTMGSATAPGGITQINSGDTLNITGAVTLSNGRILQNNNGTLSVSGDVLGSGTIDNQGTLNVVGNRTISATLNNGGQIAISSTLSLTGSGTHTGTFTVTSPGILSFASGTQSMSGGGAISGTGTLTFSGATVTIGVPVTVGALDITAGTATLNASASADAFIMNGGTLGGSGTLTLNNGGTWAGGTMSGSGSTVNPATKTVNISAPVTLNRNLQNDGTLSVSGNVSGSGPIANNGTLNAVGNIAIAATLNNDGQVATSASLAVTGSGTHTGSFTVTSPGNLSFSSGTQSMSGGGAIGGTGALTFSGAAATVGVPVNVGALSVTAGTAALDANSSANAFSMTGGTLGGSGTLTLNNGGTWSGGTMSGSGTTVNPAAKTVSITAPVAVDRNLQNDGTLTVSANVSGSGTIANNGTLNPVGSISIGAALNNSGQIATSAFLSLGGNGAHSGTFNVTAPGILDFNGGTQTISGALAGTGKLRFSGAAATVNGTWSGMPIDVAGGSVAFNTDGTIPQLTLSGGTLDGSGEITVSGPSTWSGGTIAGSGDFTFDNNATVTMPGTNAATLARPLLNKGTINFTAASNGMLIAGVAVRNNGTLNIQSSQGINATAGTPPFVNKGTLKKSVSTSTIPFGAPLANSGLVRIERGTMQFGKTYAQSAGTTTIVFGATLQTATLSLDGGSLTGNGTIAGTVANHAIVTPGSSPGTLTIDGDYVQSAAGALDIELGGTAASQYDRLLVSGSVTLDGTLDVTSTNGFMPVAGNAFQIMTFGSRVGNSTFSAMRGLTIGGTELAAKFTASDLQFTTSLLPVSDVAIAVNGPLSTIAGTKVIYAITVSNNGPDPATNIVVTAAGSPGLTFSGNSGACAGSFPCNVGTLTAGQSATIQTAWDIAPSATGDVQLTVSVNAASDANPSNNSASAITKIGACPNLTMLAPNEMTTGATAEATVTSFSGATYDWSIVNGTIDSGNGTPGIVFTAGQVGTATLAVRITGDGCTLSAVFNVTVKPLLTCVGTAAPMTPEEGAATADAVAFSWTPVDGASGYRLWLQQGDAPAQTLGTTLGTSRTKIIPPGTYQWFVETLFDGCASHESERRTLTTLPAQDCDTREAPQLSAPANETQATSAAVEFRWNAAEKALEYELWLAPAGGVPTLIRTTPDTSYIAAVPPGRLEWYVRALSPGCAAKESAHRVFTYTQPAECTKERPLLIAPLERERITSPASFEWTSVSGATSYELYVDGELAATTASPQVSGIVLSPGERRWKVRAQLAEGCGAVDSAESRLAVIASPPSCSPLESPIVSAPARISSGIPGRIQWSFVAGATAYVVEVSTDPQFKRESTTASTVAARQLPFTFTNESNAPAARYVRVHAVDTNCVQANPGAFSEVAVLLVLPPTQNEGVALLSDPTDVPYTLSLGAELAGYRFTARPTVPWISVAPASGVVPQGGQTLRAFAHTAGLVPGTNTGNVEITFAEASGALTTHGTPPPVKLPVPVTTIPGVTTAPKSTPPPDALVIPAVAKVTSFIVRYDSDICVTNASAQVMKYEIDFVPSGQAGLSEGQKTNVALEPGATMALNDIVGTWFGGKSSTGTLEIRPLTEIDPSTSSAPVGGLADRITFASSRTFSTTADGGTYGQYIPAVPYANFIGAGSTLSLQHIAQSDKYRTNLGLIEGSGDKVSLEVRIFDAAGTKRASFNVDLNGGERAQLNGVLSEHGVALDDGRIEVEVLSGGGKVTAYASVIDNATNDPQLVPPVTLDQAGRSKWVVPGVADLVSGSGHWQTDVRIFNAGAEAADLTLAFYSMNGGPATTRTITLAAREVRQLDHVLSFFAISGDAGALHMTSAAPAQVVATARTYKQTDDGAYGQFITAVPSDEAVTVGSRPMQILQMEESDRFKANIGFAEVSGKPVTLEVAVFRPNDNAPAVVEVKLAPNEFRQLNSLLASLGLGEMYNARISVRAVSGEGRALAYGSLIDHKTGDPTYIPGQ